MTDIFPVNKKLSLGKNLKKHPFRVIRFWQHQRKVRDILLSNIERTVGKGSISQIGIQRLASPVTLALFFCCPIHFFKNSLHE